MNAGLRGSLIWGVYLENREIIGFLWILSMQPFGQEHYKVLYRLLVQLAILGIKCGLTRVLAEIWYL